MIDKDKGKTKVVDKKVEADTNLDKIESDVKDDEKVEEEDSQNKVSGIAVNSKGAGQLAKEFFKILHETVSFKYSKADEKAETGVLLDELNGDKDAAEALTEDCDDICEGNEEKRNFDRKISNIVEYFFNIVKSPKVDGADRVRRKSSCFWSEQSPPDFDSRQESMNETSPDDTKIENLPSDDKVESLKEFLTSTNLPKREVIKGSRKSLDMQKNTNVKIQRKIFSKRSSSSEEKQSLLDFFFDYKGERRRKSSNCSRLTIKKQKSLEENSSRTVKLANDGEVATTSGDRRNSLVELLFKNEKTANFCSLLRRFSQDSSEICFIDESPEMKTKDKIVDLVFKCMDSFDSYVEPLAIVRKESIRKVETDSKLNILIDTKVAIAKPDNFELTPESEPVLNNAEMSLVARPQLKDMGTSCDISDSLTQFSVESEITEDPESCIEDEYWIRPEQLQELKKCAEVIFNEVQGQQENSKVAGISIDLCEQTDCPECIAEAAAKDPGENPQFQQTLDGVEDKDQQADVIGCDQCRIEAILLEAQLAAAAGSLETNFEYDPHIEDDLQVLTQQMDNLALPLYRGELEMINESFEVEDSP